jgi:energy-coupling factor transporter transmembrane protein EcfT
MISSSFFLTFLVEALTIFIGCLIFFGIIVYSFHVWNTISRGFVILVIVIFFILAVTISTSDMVAAISASNNLTVTSVGFFHKSEGVHYCDWKACCDDHYDTTCDYMGCSNIIPNWTPPNCGVKP